MSNIMQVRVGSLILTHKEVTKKVVGKYAKKLANNEDIEPIDVTFCVHTRMYYLFNGHHRAVAAYLLGMDTIKSDVDICTNYECTSDFFEGMEKYHVKEKILLKNSLKGK